ncbi:coiled-coil domain-containing protein 158 isoform X2 [Crotalus tigris]|uniref:coiled-coil domain-containing protein 158 isoform X2 n=1 Tax=Crotalus tigris TaxID=88082 RepID=UPI00192F6D14|nr:coiled-coil domain-containing protein 158 isoform X2 [Crotalus tigris]
MSRFLTRIGMRSAYICKVRQSRIPSEVHQREALQKKTQETLKLQEEATKFSSESTGRREGRSSPSSAIGVHIMTSPKSSSSSNKHSSTVLDNTSFNIPSSYSSPPKTQPSKYELEIGSPRKSSSFSGKEQVENILEEYAQQVRDLQKKLSENTEQHEQQKFALRQSVIELQTNLENAMREKESLNELSRRKESQSQESHNSRLRATVDELQTASLLQEEMLKESSSQIEYLKKLVQGHDEVFEQLRNLLLHYEGGPDQKTYGYESFANMRISYLPAAFARILQDFETEMLHLKTKLAPLEEQIDMMQRESQSKTEILLQQHQDSIERLIGDHEQDLEVLREAAKASHSHANNIQSQMEIIQEQAKNQKSLYLRQISQLEGTISQLRSELREGMRMSQDKIEDLEKQLHLVHSEMTEAQIERDQYSQESGNLDDEVQQLLRVHVLDSCLLLVCCPSRQKELYMHLLAELHKKDVELNLEKEQNKRLWDRDTGSSITIDNLRRELDNKNMELQRLDSIVRSLQVECEGQIQRQMSAIKERNDSLERESSILAQLNSTKDKLHKTVQELSERKLSLDSAERLIADLRSSHLEKERVIERTNDEIQQLRGRVESKRQEFQQLKSESELLRSVQSDCESLKVQLMEKEKVIEILQKQIESMTEIVSQHGRTAGAIETEKSQLIKEVSEKKVEVQELKISQDKKECQIRELEASLSDMELEKVKLMNVCSERLRVLKEMKLEREELVNEIKASRIELSALAEEAEVIKNDYREKNEDMETIVSKLKMQLKSAQIELEQTRATLKTMEGSDGHAMKVAMGMQKQITAKRGQIDALQSKIKFLEEAMTNATKEKHYLKEERIRLSQELSCMAALNNKLAGELEILKSQDKRLKDKLLTMEAALDKASLQFAECQCIIQRQEQEMMRYKLQHTLEVKELQGPGHTVGSSSVKQHYSSLPHSSSAPSCQTFAGHISHIPSKLKYSKEDPLRDLKQLLQELRSTIDEIPSAILPQTESDSDPDLSSTLDFPSSESIGRRSHDPCRDAAVRDLPLERTRGQETFSRDASNLRTADLEDQESTFPFTSVSQISARYTSSKKPSLEDRYKDRSPVHSLLTAPLDDLKAAPVPSLERRSSLKKNNNSPEATTATTSRSVSFTTSASIQTGESSGSACRKLQNKMENLQNLVETMQLKNQAMSTMIRCQEKKIEQAKEKEKKLSK